MDINSVINIGKAGTAVQLLVTSVRVMDYYYYYYFFLTVIQAWTRFAANETANKASTDHKKRRNRNPGIVYRVCKRDGSNYSVRKTILPTRENGDPTFAADDPAVKAKLIMRKINEVEKC